jgi:hypothetical protein
MSPDDDVQLKSLLREWTVPGAPDGLEGRLDRARAPWWRTLLTASIRVPVPLAAGLALLLGYGAWRVSGIVSAPCVASAPSAQQQCWTGRSC